jgi:predicted DNA-binding transcriptional regulator YafY
MNESAVDFFALRVVMGNPEVASRFLRLKAILNALRAGDPVNCRQMSVKFGCVSKTIHRDIESLRDQGLRIDFDFFSNTFRLRTPSTPAGGEEQPA